MARGLTGDGQQLMAAQTQAAGIAGSGFGTLGLWFCVSSGLSDLKAIQTQVDCTSLHRGHKAKNEWAHLDSLFFPRWGRSPRPLFHLDVLSPSGQCRLKN